MIALNSEHRIFIICIYYISNVNPKYGVCAFNSKIILFKIENETNEESKTKQIRCFDVFAFAIKKCKAKTRKNKMHAGGKHTVWTFMSKSNSKNIYFLCKVGNIFDMEFVWIDQPKKRWNFQLEPIHLPQNFHLPTIC